MKDGWALDDFVWHYYTDGHPICGLVEQPTRDGQCRACIRKQREDREKAKVQPDIPAV